MNQKAANQKSGQVVKKPMAGGALSGAQNSPGSRVPIEKPQQLAIDLIDEDPLQPRQEDSPGFSVESLRELATTIQDRGVKSPISVRENPAAAGRYLVNHGARRLRASKLAGHTSIPAFVDNDYSEVDQVVENLQRNELTAREIANFIGRELAKGKSKKDIARDIGKSAAFVTQHATLLNLPVPIADAFNQGRSKDVTVINELVTAFKKHPEQVSTWVSDESQDLTRGSVKMLREYLEDKIRQIDIHATLAEGAEGEEGAELNFLDEQPAQYVVSQQTQDSEPSGRLRKAVVMVKYNDRVARLLMNRRPPKEGWAWFKYEDREGKEFKAALAKVQLVALIEG